MHQHQSREPRDRCYSATSGKSTFIQTSFRCSHSVQDPASTGAAAVNKAITLELAKQIAAVGGDPQDALKAGTFAPGDLNDSTAKGNTCDDANDAAGCIFSQNLIVEDATAAEITAAVAGVATGTNNAGTNTDNASTEVCAARKFETIASLALARSSLHLAAVTVTVTAGAAATATATKAASAAPAATTTAAAAAGGNLQKFTGARKCS